MKGSTERCEEEERLPCKGCTEKVGVGDVEEVQDERESDRAVLYNAGFELCRVEREDCGQGRCGAAESGGP